MNKIKKIKNNKKKKKIKLKEIKFKIMIEWNILIINKNQLVSTI